MSRPNRGPKALSEILGELFAVRGYNQLCAREMLEKAWNSAVGEPDCAQTRLGEVRHGVLNVVVAHAALLEELAAFRKPSLLKALHVHAPGTAIHDIRFHVGLVEVPVRSSSVTVSPPKARGQIAKASPRPRGTRAAKGSRRDWSSG
jgi:hypothetical protein